MPTYTAYADVQRGLQKKQGTETGRETAQITKHEYSASTCHGGGTWDQLWENGAAAGKGGGTVTDEAFELHEDTAEKVAAAKGIRHKKGYRSRKVMLPYESLKGAERKTYMGESTTSINLQQLTWEQFLLLDKEGRIKVLKNMVVTYGRAANRLSDILGGYHNSAYRMIEKLGISGELDKLWNDIPDVEKAAANKRGKDLAKERRKQKKAPPSTTDATMPAVQETPIHTPSSVPEALTPPAPLYWAETTIRRNGVAGKELRAQLAGLLQSVTDNGIYDVKIAVGAKEV